MLLLLTEEALVLLGATLTPQEREAPLRSVPVVYRRTQTGNHIKDLSGCDSCPVLHDTRRTSRKGDY
jgi:hypothetical protein